MRAVCAPLGVRALVALLTALSTLCAQGRELPQGVQAGDLIFREGTETVSAMVMGLAPDARYSHVGMLIGGPENWQVLHATPSEMAGRADGVVLDSLAFFVDPARSRHHAVYRIKQADPAVRIAAVAGALSELGVPFRIADAAGTYCTVLIWKAWRDAGLDLEVRFTRLSIPLNSGSYLLPGDLLASPYIRRAN